MINLRFLFVGLVSLSFATLSAKNFIWYNGKEPINYSISNNISPVVRTALNMFEEDMELVTGQKAIQASSSQSTIQIIQLDSEEVTDQEKLRLQQLGIPIQEIITQKDAFFIAVLGKGKQRKLYVTGSDNRGTAYGILELSRYAGVSPWVWWGDVTPDKKTSLTISNSFKTLQSPSVEYRGIFINDEDWTLQPWSWKHFEPKGVDGLIGPKTYKEIFKFLMRMRANAIWPGMHGITVPFYFVPGVKEIADSCGIVIGTSHCEPLMRNNVGEWDEVLRGRYNYLTNKKQVQSYWIERLREAGKYQNIYTIGMRGIHDGAMEGVKTLNEQTEALQQVIDDQRELLKEHVNPDIKQIPQQFVPYKEVLQIMENGLQVPDDVMLTWCDDNYGYMTRLSDEEQQKRSGGAGVYYHLNYWGRPHDYMWLCTIQPGLIYNEMKEAYDHNARRLWIANVHDLKPAAYDLELFLDMAWDINSVSPSTLNKHQEAWLCREFGEEAGKKLLPAMLEFYRLTSIRKPEFMGWNQVELSKKIYARGWSPVSDTEFSQTEFGGELDRYLQDYQAIKEILMEAEDLIPSHRKDAFFGQIKYPVFGSAAMATKMLEAQKARAIAAAMPEKQWKDNEALIIASAKSSQAYQEIIELTNYYNNEMSDGKWKHSMSYKPRNLYVFGPPRLPIEPSKEQKDKYGNLPAEKVKQVDEIIPDQYIVSNAYQYHAASKNIHTVENLGHSMLAVSLPKNDSLVYEFDSPWEGEAILYTALIPTQPNDKGDIRYSIQIDNEKPRIISIRQRGRTSKWKLNVLRGQALNTSDIHLTKGKHKLTIKALDNHILIDQWMIDFKKDRKFYVFPVASANL